MLTETRIALAERDAEDVAKGLRLMAAITKALAGESLLISASTVLLLDLGYLDALREALDRGLDDTTWLHELASNLESTGRRYDG